MIILEKFIKAAEVELIMKGFCTLDIPIPVEHDESLLFTGSSIDLKVKRGKIILPDDIFQVIESRQRNLPRKAKHLIFITDFDSEHRCFPYDDALFSLANKYEGFKRVLIYIPQHVRIRGGKMAIPDLYHQYVEVSLVPS